MVLILHWGEGGKVHIVVYGGGRSIKVAYDQNLMPPPPRYQDIVSDSALIPTHLSLVFLAKIWILSPLPIL